MRLTGFDYSRPFFYMVTMKCLPNRQPLSGIIAPDLLMQALEGRYRETTGIREPVFAADWHDWIVDARGLLAAFTRYIRENPRRWWLRHENRQYFTQVGRLALGGREWFAYGNPALLELPVVAPFQCSRKWAPDGPEWRSALARAGRIGPGGAGIGTFMSPCEKECGNAIVGAGGSLIVLSPEGFAPRWHPTSKQEALCAKGRMLFLSLYEPTAAKLDNATLYRRCHEMGDLAVAALTPGIGTQLLGDRLATGRAEARPTCAAPTGRAEARPALAADRRLP